MVLALAGCLAASVIPLAQAGLIGTHQISRPAENAAFRTRLAALVERPEVVAELTRLGVPVTEARARIAALSDGEAALLAQRIDSLPAGGADVLGALLVVFVVLLVTDIVGLTKVFRFIRPIK